MPSEHHPEIIIPIEQLQSVLQDPAILPVFVGSEEAFNQAHIPGSALIRPAELVCGAAPATGKIPDTDDLAQLFAKIGLDKDRIVIAYDDEGGGWAGRLIWTLDVTGHKNYHYIDGGIVAWKAEQQAIETGASQVNSIEEQPINIDSNQIVTANDIIEALDDPNFIVWDARSAQEYAGEKVLAARGGHIPGAANLDWLDLIDRSNHTRLKPIATIQNMLSERKLSTEKTIVTHCQTHHRSGLTYLAGKILGLNIKAYDGSWSEWGNLDNTPIE